MRSPIHSCWVFVVLACSVSMTMAATTDTPEARAEIEKYGNTYSGKRIGELRAIYKEHLAEVANETADVLREVSYGPHERQRLDVFKPQDPSGEPMPVLVFIHGGAFVRGDKSDGIIFDNVLNYFVPHGVLGINATYRLAPEYQWPAGADDIRDIVRWVRENAREHGGDPTRIYLMGHSAGAAHVATYSFVEELQLNDGNDGVVGSILLSGTFGEGSEESMLAYYGEDRSLWAERVPISHIDGRKIPLFVINAEYDRTSMAKESIGLIQAICDRDDRCPDHKQISGHNHYSMMYHFNTADDSIAGDILEFMQ